MTKVHAIFENGVFRPIEPVTIDDGARVELFVEEFRGIPAAHVDNRGSFPVIRPPIGTPSFTNDDVAEGLEDN